MTVIRILLHCTPVGVLEALGKSKEGEGEHIYDMLWMHSGEKPSSPFSDGHVNHELTDERHGRDFQGDHNPQGM